VNVEVSTIYQPRPYLSSFVMEPNALVEGLGHDVLRVNRQFDSRQAALGGMGNSVCDERTTNATASLSVSNSHAESPNVFAYICGLCNNVAPTDYFLTPDGDEVGFFCLQNPAIVRKRTVLRPRLGEGKESLFTAHGIKEVVQSFEVIFTEGFKMKRHGLQY